MEGASFKDSKCRKDECDEVICNEVDNVWKAAENKADTLKVDVDQLDCEETKADKSNKAAAPATVAAPVVAATAAAASAAPKKDSGGMPGWAIALIVIGSILLLGGVGAYLYYRQR